MVEALFLVAVAVGATVADLRAVAVIALMAAAWIVVVLLEWTAWLDEPHYGRGLPPRFYVPQVALPPPRPVEQPRSGYPTVREEDDAPTFVASPAEWAAALDEWPVLGSSPVGEETEIAFLEEPLPQFPPEIQFPPEFEPPPEPPEAELADGEDIEPEATDPEATGPEAEAEPAPGPEPEPGQVAVALPEPVAREQPAPPAMPPFELPDVAPVGVSSHRIDPLAPTRRSRLRRRQTGAAALTVAVPDRPPADRALPGGPRDGSTTAAR